MAAALVEDLGFLRDACGRANQTPGEIRRLSGTLRRILIDRDINIVASPRTGKLLLSCPDNHPAYAIITQTNCHTFISLGMEVFGVFMRAIMISEGSPKLGNFDPVRVGHSRLDNFLTQGVIFHQGRWVSRAAVIKYVAYIKHGIHSGTPNAKDKEDTKTLDSVRRSSRVQLNEAGLATVLFDTAAQHPAGEEFVYDDKMLDCVLLELLATAHFVVASPDVIALEKVVREELSAR